LPPNGAVTKEAARAIAEKHGLSGDVARMPKLGIVNDIWSIGGEYVLRIPSELEYVDSLYVESVAAPAARNAGVRTPEVVVFDDTLDLIAVPFMVTRMEPGKTLGATPLSPTWDLAASEWSAVLDGLGEQLVCLHQKVKSVDDPNGRLNPWWLDSPDESLRRCIESETLSLDLATWVQALIEKLHTAFDYDPDGPTDHSVFVHHDTHPWNIMVMVPPNGGKAHFSALLDWGCACWGDPAVDFAGFPLWALPPLVDAYKLAGGVTDETFEGRVLYMWLALALREKSFLDPNVFSRHWWRMPTDGVNELKYRLPMLPKVWSKWTL